MLIGNTGNTPNVYLFAGEQYDHDLALYYNRARYLDVNKGRFLSQDAFEGINAEPLSLHKYLYTRGNPVNRIDPSGHRDLVEVAAVASIIGIFAGAAVGSLNSYVVNGKVNPIDAIIGAGLGAVLAPIAVLSPLVGIGLAIGGTGVSAAQAYILFDDPSVSSDRLAFAVLLTLISLVGVRAAYKARITPRAGSPSNTIETPANAALPSGQIPPAKPGTVRVYRGIYDGDPDVLQVGKAYRNDPSSAPSGAENFLSPHEAEFHAGNITSTGVSVTRHLGTAQDTYGPRVIAYDVPEAVFERLPRGDIRQDEFVFGYSIPKEYKVGVIEGKK